MAAMEIRLPDEKLRYLMSLLWAWIPRKSCSKQELLSLIGSLQHVSVVIRPGRVFLRRMIDLSKHQMHQMHLDAPMRLNKGVSTHWTGPLDWTTGLDYWTRVVGSAHAQTRVRVYKNVLCMATPRA